MKPDPDSPENSQIQIKDFEPVKKVLRIKVGVDLINIKRFKKVLKSGGKEFIDRVFSQVEFGQSKEKGMVSLASIFAGKEAIIKALNLSAENWLAIEILHSGTGRPEVFFLDKKIKNKLKSFDLSISHTREHVIAFFVCFLAGE